MNGPLRTIVAPALLVAACIGIATMLAVPDDAPEKEPSAAELARIDDFVERFIRAQRTALHVLEEGGES